MNASFKSYTYGMVVFHCLHFIFSAIQLTVGGDINIRCQDNSVFVFDGLPDLISSNYQNHALGTFCQRDDKQSLTVETKSGE